MRVYRNLTSARSTATTIFPFRRRGRAHLHPHTAARRLRVIDGATSRRSVGRQFYCRQRFTVQNAWTMLRRIGSGSFIRCDATCTLTAPGLGCGFAGCNLVCRDLVAAFGSGGEASTVP